MNISTLGIVTFYVVLTFFGLTSPVSAQDGCAQIEAVRVSPSTIEKKQRYTCEVDVAAGDVGSKSIGCGISFDNGYPRNFCPSDVTFKGWQGNTAVFECIFPDGNFQAEKVEAVGWDFSCDAANGKRALINLVEDEEDPEASATPKPVDVQEQEARSLLTDVFTIIFNRNGGSSNPPDQSTPAVDPTENPQNPPNEPPPSQDPTPVLSNGSCGEGLTRGACNAKFIVNEIKRGDTCGGRVSSSNSQCLYRTNINRNTASIGIQNSAQPCPYCYLQCWGVAAMNMHDGLGSPSDLKANALHHNGLNWPTDLAMRATNHVRSLYTIGRFNTDSTAPSQRSLPTCQSLIQQGQVFLVIWGFHNAARPGNQHIAPGYFVDPAKTQIEIHEGNADWRGLVSTRRVAASSPNLTYCLVPKPEKFPNL